MDDQPQSSPPAERPSARSRAQWTLVGVIVSLAVGMAAYRLLHAGQVDETAALFIGLPTLLAVALALTPRARSATGMIMKGLTIALLLSGPLLQEGFICVLMASPLFYLVGALVGWAVDADRARRARRGRPVHSLVVLPLLLMSVEGLSPSVSLPRDLSATSTRIVAAAPAAVEARLAARPRFAETLPLFLRIGFPRPTGAAGEGLAIGDRRDVYFSRAAAPKTLAFVVAERAPGYVRFRVVSDDTKIGTWLTWRDAEVRWTPRADGRTDVEWTLHFSRRLSPAWYFGPLESFGAAAAADYLVDSLATPDVASPTLVRAAALLVPLGLTWGLLVWRRPDRRLTAAAFLASAWVLPSSLALNLLAIRLGWWTFQARGGVFLGVPVDLWLGWTLFWGAVPLLAFPRAAPWLLAAAVAWVDVVAMPAAAPVVRLGPDWLLGESLGIAAGLVPAQLLGGWTRDGRRLAMRAGAQLLVFASGSVWLLPSMILELTGGSWRTALDSPAWQLGAVAQLLAVPALMGAAAVLELAQRGGGTPFPWDPPERLVASGPYAYVANPMQISMTLLMVGVGLVLASPSVALAGLVAGAFGGGFARWQEAGEMDARFGRAWRDYRAAVRAWLPRWRPSALAAATLYYAETCAECSQVGAWFSSRDPVCLALRAAESCPAPSPTRLTYIAADGQRFAGVAALARALDHVNLAWAWLGWALRLPGICQTAQLLGDALGAGPRSIPSRPPPPPALD